MVGRVRLDQHDRKLVSLALRPDLVARLNDICHQKHIVRDAFFDRLFLLLAVSSEGIDRLFFNDTGGGNEWRGEVWREYKAEFFRSGGFYPLQQDIDPFWAIRAGLEIYTEESTEEYTNPETAAIIQVQRYTASCVAPVDSVYAKYFDGPSKDLDLRGFNCYMPDWKIPDSAAKLTHAKELDAMLINAEPLL